MTIASAAVSRAYGWRWRVLPPATGIAMMAMLLGALLAAPREAIQGEVQRLFYIHISSVMAAYLAFTVTFVASILLLWKRDMRYDPVARAAAGVGVFFISVTLATGSIWGKPIWGTWWAWDARLTFTLVLLLIFIGYLLVRGVARRSDEQTARYAAVFAIIGFLDIPLIHMSVSWWRTLHPQPLLAGLPAEMAAVSLVGVIAISLLAVWLIVLRAETETMAARAEALSAELDRFEGA